MRPLIYWYSAVIFRQMNSGAHFIFIKNNYFFSQLTFFDDNNS